MSNGKISILKVWSKIKKNLEKIDHNLAFHIMQKFIIFQLKKTASNFIK